MSHLYRQRRFMLVFVLVSLALSGCILQYSGYTIDCVEFQIDITYARATVDNTGTGDEIVGAQAVDGAGRSLYYNQNEHQASVGFELTSTTDGFSWTTAPLYNPITVTYFNPAGGDLSEEVEIASFTGECPGLPVYGSAAAPDEPIDVDNEPVGPTGIDDGRLNRMDVAAPVAIFPVDYGTGIGLHIYAIGADGTGTLVLEVTPEMIVAVPDLPEENTLIAATPDRSIALYRLATGEFQLNAGEYVVVFRDLTPTAAYYQP